MELLVRPAFQHTAASKTKHVVSLRYASVGHALGNAWRIGPDDTNWAGVLTNIDINNALAPFAAPGGWNDPCLLLSVDLNGKQRMTELQV